MTETAGAMGLWNLSNTPFHHNLSAKEGKRLIKAAYRKGIRLFDAAYSYNDAESILQSAMKEIGKDDWLVITKVMPVASMEKKAEISLRRLKRDYVDYLLLHWPTDDDSLYSSLKALESLKDKGKAMEIGVSNFPLPLLEKIISDFDITAHERPLSLVWTKWWPEEKKLGLKTLSYAPLGMGILSGRYKSANEIKDKRRTLPLFSSPLIKELLSTIDASIALSWVYGEKPFAVISGYGREEDLSILDNIKTLPEKRQEELRRIAGEITASCNADNPFSHNWRSNAYTH